MTEELKLIVELFSKVTDGALIGGVTYLVLQFLTNIAPYVVWTVLGTKLLNRLPKLLIKPKGE